MTRLIAAVGRLIHAWLDSLTDGCLCGHCHPLDAPGTDR